MEMEKAKNFYDAVIIGGGPAGLAAALYLARARYRVVVVEKDRFGGQITITADVVNYPGIEYTTGAKLGEVMQRQALGFGAEFITAEVESVDLTGDVKFLRTSRGELRSFGVVLATGAHPRKVGFKGESEFQGRGVAYCATCDGEFFTGKDIFVIGGGFAAAEEAVFLTKYARRVFVLVRKPDFSCAASVADIARGHEKITVLCNSEVVEVAGDTVLRSLRYRDVITDKITEYRPPEGETFGVFVFAGYVPATGLVRGMVELDKSGYVIVDRAQCTSIPGVYAAGDICVKSLRQVVTAVSDGAIAATELEKYASAMQEKTGLVPPRPERTTGLGEAESKVKESVSVSGGLFDDDMRAQLAGVFEKMSRPLSLRLTLDDRPVSAELRGYIEELVSLTDKLTMEIVDGVSADFFPPSVRVFLADGTDTGIAFHGIPGGHEFTSFVLALYNASGPGQALDDDMRSAIKAIRQPVSIQVLISLNCTVCPDTVKAAQRIAAENPNITAAAYDLQHFPVLRDKYNVMSVPCVVVNGDRVFFGGKNVRQLVSLIR